MYFLINKKKETNSIIIFLHLPKSGGNTFYDIIRKQKQYALNNCILRNCQVDDLTIEEQKRVEMVYGHMHFGVHKKLPQTEFTYITFLRHPIERVISHFYFHRSENNPDVSLRDMFNKMTLFDYVTNEEWDLNVSYLPASTVNIQTCMLTDLMLDDLETAQKNLENYFSIVGITERFDETLYVLEKKLGWEINYNEKKNVTPNKPARKEISQDIIEIIKNKNKKDLVLYQFANQLLDKQLQLIK